MYWSLPGSSCSETRPNPGGTLALPRWASALLSVKRGAWAGRAQAGHGTALPAASAVLLVGPQSPADLPHVSSSHASPPCPPRPPAPFPHRAVLVARSPAASPHWGNLAHPSLSQPWPSTSEQHTSVVTAP